MGIKINICLRLQSYHNTKNRHTVANNAKNFKKRKKSFIKKERAQYLKFGFIYVIIKLLMKKFVISLLSCICVSATFLGATTAVFADTGVGETAPAAQNATLTKDDLSLLLPSGYEQYLALDEVGGIAVQNGYIAVANANKIYVYNGEKYLTYEDSQNANSIVHLEWNNANVLYFKYANSSVIYTLDCTQDVLTAIPLTDLEEGCNAFTLNGDEVYNAYISGSTITIREGNEVYTTQNIETATNPIPCMTYMGGALYYTAKDVLYVTKKTTNSTTTVEYRLEEEAHDIVVKGNILYYTDKNTLYTYNLDERRAEKSYQTDGVNYTMLSLDGDYLYVAGKMGESTKIFRFDTVKDEFTDYEIATSSSSPNRLISAKKSIVSGNYLITADQKRISLYNYKQNSYFCFPCEITPEYLASNGESIVIANDEKVYAYDFEGTPLSLNATFNNVVGVTSAKDGNYFIVTQNDIYYVLNAQDFTVTNHMKSVSGDPTAITADIYGNLYVEYSDKNVYKYTQSQFASEKSGSFHYTLPTSMEKLSVDFDGNVFGLANDTLYCSNGNTYKIDETDCLFNATADLIDFAFGYEEKTVYFIYEDYILSTETIDLPNLKNLAAGEAYQTIFEENDNQNGVVPVVTLNEDGILLHFALEELTKTSEVFPYVTYTRVGEGVNAVVLGETQIHNADYYMVAVFNASTRKYTAGLTLKTACTPLAESDYASTPENFENKAGRITNEVMLYKYPYLTSSLTLAKLEKNSVVTVLKELSLGDDLVDYDYYYVSYTDEAGNVHYGYTPKNFVRDFEGLLNAPVSVYYKVLLCEKDITATSADNQTVTLEAGKKYSVSAYLDDAENGKVLISLKKNGVTYFATVAADSLQQSSPDILRYFLIVILLVLDVVLIVNYLVFKPKE